MSVQLRVKAGDRIKIVIPPENLAFGADRVYPDGGTGTAIDCIDKKGHNHGCVDSQGLALTKLDIPFERTALLGDEDLPKKLRKKSKIMTEMGVPTWFPLEILPPGK